jgi:leucine dehydrogenase
VADVDVDSVARVVRDFGVRTVPPERIHAVDCDIFAPCALGGVVNADTIPQLRCRAIAGSANNQLQRAEDGKALAELGILYAPDFITNAGGLINVADELSGYTPERARASVERVYRTLREIFTIAREDHVGTAAAADHYAESRLERISRLRRYWVPTPWAAR